MTLPQVSPGLLPAENYRRFNQAFQAVDAVVSNIAVALASLNEEAIRRSEGDSAVNGAVVTEQLRREQAISTINSALIEEAVRRQQAIGAVNGAVTAEQIRREQAVAQVYVAIAQQADRLQTLIAGGDATLGSKITQTASDLRAAIALKADAATVTALANRPTAQSSRPGADPIQFTVVTNVADLGGPRASLLPLDTGYIRTGENGAVARMSGPLILASRTITALEAGRQYRPRAVFQRRTNPIDPSGDTVRFGLVYLDQSLRVMGGLVRIQDFPKLLSADGRQERQALISRNPGLSGAFQAPNGARFAVPAVQFFGPDHVTDVEVLTIDDVTNAYVLSPPTSEFDARVAALETADMPSRIENLEASAGTPSKTTYRTKADAAAATIPATVQVVEILGGQAAGDGRGGSYVRTSATLPPNADSFTSHGAVFVRVALLPDVAAMLMLTGTSAFMAGLPQAPPSTPGQPWNNGKLLCVS